MLTRPGWTCLWGGVVLLVAARMLGIGELYVFGAVALGLVAAAVLYARLVRLDLEVHRRVHPAQVHVGQASRVELRVRNLRAGDTPVLRLHDPVSGTAGAELLVPPLDRGAASVARYRLPTDRRGMVAVGPLRVVVTDPFGLAQAGVRAAPRVEVTVFPHIDDVRPAPHTTGNDPLTGILHPHAVGRSGDDFYALRPYVVGDDLRRVHWPSTARHDELLVRQQEQPWQGRTTVLLDVRRAGHDDASFEAAVSAAASVVSANCARNDQVRLATTDGTDSGFGTGTTHLRTLLEHLAVVAPSGNASLRAVLDVLQRDGQGALVVVVGRVPAGDLEAVGRLRQRYGLVRVVRIDSAAPRTTRPAGDRPTTVPVIGVEAGASFADAWNRAMTSPQPAWAARGPGR